MASSSSQKLIDNSIAAAIAAIEIYNKPQFSYRNEVFCMLIVNAWELLFKAKILVDNKDKIEALYVIDPKGNPRLNRSGSPLTIDIYRAIHLTSPAKAIANNVQALIDLRDTCTHYVSKQPIDYLVFSLGSACLRNYQKCIKTWFNKDLLEYNFYILPLGFSNSFKGYRLLDINKEPHEIKRLIELVSKTQEATENEGEYLFNCEIKVTLTSAKKITNDTDLIVTVDPSSKDVVVVEKMKKITDSYPISSDELWSTIHKTIPDLKQTDFYKFLKEKKIKGNEKYAAYNFRYKRYEEDYKRTGKVATGTAVLYNQECVLYLNQEIPKFLKKSEK